MTAMDPRVQAALARDPELARLAGEVDRSLIRWMLELTPMQRLRAATRGLRGLRRFKRVAPEGS